MRLSLENRFFVFCTFFLGIVVPIMIIIDSIANEYESAIFWVLLVGAVCGTVFWHRISDQIQYLLIFNLLWIPSFIFFGVLHHLFSFYVLDVQIDTDEFFGYWILSAQCVVLCFGIIKYKKKMENAKPSIFFLLLGKMAKADGQVSKDEIDTVEALMVSAEFDQDTKKKAIGFFNVGKTTTRSFYEIALELARCDIGYLLKCQLVKWLLELAYADGVLHAIEERYLNDAVTAFGLSPDILTQALEKEYLKKETRNQSSQALSEDEKQAILFFMLGKMAKADGQVSKDEIDAVETFMTRADFDQDTRKKAIVFFNAGKTTTRPFYEIAAEFAQCDIDDLHAILEWLLELVFADGVLHAIEEQYLNDAVTAFGLSPDILTQAIEKEERLSEIRKYYAILDCDLLVSDDELKRRYRELSKQYHPDRIFSKDLPPDLHKFSKEKFQEIQNAYEVITEHRK